jgi:hypothetical protein
MQLRKRIFMDSAGFIANVFKAIAIIFTSNIQIIYMYFFISKFILRSIVVHLAELCVRLQWLGERHSVDHLRK